MDDELLDGWRSVVEATEEVEAEPFRLIMQSIPLHNGLL